MSSFSGRLSAICNIVHFWFTISCRQTERLGWLLNCSCLFHLKRRLLKALAAVNPTATSLIVARRRRVLRPIIISVYFALIAQFLRITDEWMNHFRMGLFIFFRQWNCEEDDPEWSSEPQTVAIESLDSQSVRSQSHEPHGKDIRNLSVG